MPWTMYDREGQRKYLTRSEREAFLQAARARSPEINAFCSLMAATGCRISEALSLTGRNIDFEAKQVIIECLKKRRKSIFRAVPLPAVLLEELQELVARQTSPQNRLWPWSRMTGYRRICEVMQVAGVEGSHATPKGLRHGFGVCAIQAKVPLNLVQRWLGHADIKTTAIYTSAMGPEEREIAARMWDDSFRETEAEGNAAKFVENGGNSASLAEIPAPETPAASAEATTKNPRNKKWFQNRKIKSKIISDEEKLQFKACKLLQFWIERHNVGALEFPRSKGDRGAGTEIRKR